MLIPLRRVVKNLKPLALLLLCSKSKARGPVLALVQIIKATSVALFEIVQTHLRMEIGGKIRAIV